MKGKKKGWRGKQLYTAKLSLLKSVSQAAKKQLRCSCSAQKSLQLSQILFVLLSEPCCWEHSGSLWQHMKETTLSYICTSCLDEALTCE